MPNLFEILPLIPNTIRIFLLQISTSEGLEIADNAIGISLLHPSKVLSCPHYPWLFGYMQFAPYIWSHCTVTVFYSTMRDQEHTSVTIK